MTTQMRKGQMLVRIGLAGVIALGGAVAVVAARFVESKGTAEVSRAVVANAAVEPNVQKGSPAEAQWVPLAAPDPTSLVALTSSRVTTLTNPAFAGQFTPPKLGPGAVLTFNPKTAPLVPGGMTPNKYIESYYQNLSAGRMSAAAKLVPKNSPRQSLKDFKALQYGYEVGRFNVLSTVPTAEGINSLAVNVTPNNGVWDVNWRFVRTARGLVLKDLTYARPGRIACH